MKVVILAGGLGTRISEYTRNIPKPMIEIKGQPILLRIMKHYYKFGFKDFYIASGYKGKIIKNYFKNKKFNFKVNIIDTGLNTMTGGRVLRLKKILKSETFLLTYGDGLSDVNIKNLIRFHKKSKNYVTLTAVRPPARFGAIKLNGNRVKVFKEKSRLDEGWINGGFFVMSPKIFKFIKNDKSYLERHPLENLSKKNKLGAYKHFGFWQCMDTLRDKEILEKKIKKA
ncbi:MAG: glucose-1-phosphate cytidylyltransferase [Candidatus Pelagibacter sp.]|nr:glucose-1-phosphate cytidylyltransferase [Candidatus Pelagibacter sp.]OUW23377.1 MAG: glucose-1-phosphate cytidylyltransferase [Rickettsiales bacterium TMED174]|tara:strand:- start:337 stop:1017 length:681 start_codon:yes stop_codon:yes gene_type:complete